MADEVASLRGGTSASAFGRALRPLPACGAEFVSPVTAAAQPDVADAAAAAARRVRDVAARLCACLAGAVSVWARPVVKVDVVEGVARPVSQDRLTASSNAMARLTPPAGPKDAGVRARLALKV